MRHFLKLFRPERKSLSLADEGIAALFGMAPSASGVIVTPEAALRCTIVRACVSCLADSVAQLPLILYRRAGDGGKERATDHPAYALLHDLPNEWTTSFDFRQFVQGQAALHGNGYAYVNRVGGKVRELIALPSGSVSVEPDPDTLEPVYTVTWRNGRQNAYRHGDILHIRTLGTDPWRGDSPVQHMREAIGLALVMEKYGARLFSNGARPSGVLKYGKAVGPERLKQLRESFQSAFGGGENAGRALILEDGMDWAQSQFSSVDLEFNALRRFQIEEIARGFRIPLPLVGDLNRATFNNSESQGQQFLSMTLMPWLKAWEQAINRVVLTPDERGHYHAEFLTDELARANLAARFDAYAKAVGNGLLCPNEVRDAENRPPYAGGDQFRLPLNTENANAGAAQAREAGDGAA